MSLVGQIAALQDYKEYEELNWEGSFEDYLDLVRKNPRVTRTAFQRVYDMILSHGQKEYIDNKKKLDPLQLLQRRPARRPGRDLRPRRPADEAGERLQVARRSGYGTERRVLLLHGPVGSAKSTIARLLKKGLEEYSRTPDGALYTFSWTLPGAARRARRRQRGVPLPDARGAAAPHPARVARRRRSPSSALGNDDYRVKIDGDLSPACRLDLQAS